MRIGQLLTSSTVGTLGSLLEIARELADGTIADGPDHLPSRAVAGRAAHARASGGTGTGGGGAILV
ncbi:MAG TPA: hypothetical protein VGG75_35890 [Trebonia sp.]|jgi:hypothetical protein